MEPTLTPRQIANRKNAQKSTGPRTAEGKARSSKNALTHGLTSKADVLPNEDPERYEAYLSGWFKTMGPTDAVEVGLVETAGTCAWRTNRCILAEQGRLAFKIRHAKRDYDLEQRLRAETLGKRLVDDPIYRPSGFTFTHSPENLAEFRRNDPVMLMLELQSFAKGVEWLIERLSRFLERFEEQKFLFPDERFELARLFGKRPEEVHQDPLVRKIVLYGHTLHTTPFKTYNDICTEAIIACDGKVIYPERSLFHYSKRPTDLNEARDELLDMIEFEIERLTKLKVELEAFEAPDREEAPLRAMFDDSKEAQLMLRYESTHQRAFHRAVNDLNRKRDSEAKAARQELKEAAIEVEKAPERAEVVGEMASEETSEPTVSTRRTPPPNEPNRESALRDFEAGLGRMVDLNLFATPPPTSM